MARHDSLTPRQQQVLALLRDGLSNEEIAERLGISVQGAKYHVSEILSKLGVENRADAARWRPEERRAWWALAPLALSWRRAAGVAVAAVLVAGVAVGVGVVVWGMARTKGDGPQELPGRSWQESALATKSDFLSEPVRTQGDGWSLETRVSNLEQLDLAVLVEELGWRVTLVDVNTGDAVAVGDFGFNIHVRLRREPPQLLVADSDPPRRGDRLLVFDMSNAGLTLAREMPLPQRPGYQGFANQMFLSPDEKTLFITQRRDVNSPECEASGGGAIYCYEHSVGVLDLDTMGLYSVEHGPGCDSAGLWDVGAASPVFACGGGIDVLRTDATVGERRSGCEVVRRTGVDDSMALLQCLAGLFSVEGDGMRRLDVVEGLGFIRNTADGLRGITAREGRIVDDQGATIAALAERAVWANGVFHLQDDVVLVGINPPAPSDTLYSEMLVVDLRDGHVFRRFDVDVNVWDAIVIDPSRLLFLVKDGQRVELQQVDLRTGDIVRTLEPQGLPGLPTALER